eukprot:560540-Rhodomonas_salina.1
MDTRRARAADEAHHLTSVQVTLSQSRSLPFQSWADCHGRPQEQVAAEGGGRRRRSATATGAAACQD